MIQNNRVVSLWPVGGLTGNSGQDISEESARTYKYHDSYRYYCYADARFTYNGNSTYGASYYQASATAGTGADPVLSWAARGHIVEAGEIVKKIQVLGRANSTEVTDMDIRVLLMTPKAGVWDGGIDNIAELDVVEIFKSNFVQPSFSGNMGDYRMMDLPIDFMVPQLGHIVVAMKPIRTGTATHYFYQSTTLVMESAV